jgi:hypothetical protein
MRTHEKPACSPERGSATRRNGRALLLASCEARGLIDTPVVATVGPKHPLFFGGVYEPPRAGATDRGPRLRAARGLLAKIGRDPSFATSRAVEHPGAPFAHPSHVKRRRSRVPRPTRRPIRCSRRSAYGRASAFTETSACAASAGWHEVPGGPGEILGGCMIAERTGIGLSCWPLWLARAALVRSVPAMRRSDACCRGRST